MFRPTVSSNDFSMRIGILGAGNMAWQLGPALQRAGIPVVAVCSRTDANARELSHHLACPSYTNWSEMASVEADVWLCCLADSAFDEVLPKLKLPKNAQLVHTSGSQPLSALAPYQKHIGVFYPLQTMTKGKRVDMMQVPFFVEGNSPEVTASLKALAQKLSPHVYEADSEQRSKLHLSAVFACNFANHMWAIADELLQEQGQSIHVLRHLMQETVDKALMLSPQKAQTGPAVRHDENIMWNHLKSLDSHPRYKELYEKISSSIQEVDKALS